MLYNMAYTTAENIALREYIGSAMKSSKEEQERVIAELEAKAQKDIPTITLAPFSTDIEKHLNAVVLIAHGIEEEEKHHEDFWLLGLMQLGCALKALKTKDSNALDDWLHNMSESIERGYRQRDSENAYKRNKNEEAKVRFERGKKAAKERHSKKHGKAEKEARKLFESQHENPSIFDKDKALARFIHDELLKTYPIETEKRKHDVSPSFSTVWKNWIPAFRKNDHAA